MQLKTTLTFGQPGEQVIFSAGTVVAQVTNDEIAAEWGLAFVPTIAQAGVVHVRLGGKIRCITLEDVKEK